MCLRQARVPEKNFYPLHHLRPYCLHTLDCKSRLPSPFYPLSVFCLVFQMAQLADHKSDSRGKTFFSEILSKCSFHRWHRRPGSLFTMWCHGYFLLDRNINERGIINPGCNGYDVHTVCVLMLLIGRVWLVFVCMCFHVCTVRSLMVPCDWEQPPHLTGLIRATRTAEGTIQDTAG